MPGSTKSAGPRASPRRDLLASLKLAQLEISKPVLPAEIMAFILEYLGPSDLICVAKTSRRMHEMVYDDSRWVKILKRMGCWNDAEARKHAKQSNGLVSVRVQAPSIRIQSNDADKPPPHLPLPAQGAVPQQSHREDRNSGFDNAELVAAPTATHNGPLIDGATALTVLKNIRSLRGRAREEYGKVHKALYPFYKDIVKAVVTTDSKVFKTFQAPEQQAQLLSELQAFAKADVGAGYVGREQRVLSAVSLFETAALREFRSGYECGDIDGLMRRYAQVLILLNGGDSAVDLFIHHNHLISRKSEFGHSLDGLNGSSGTVSLDHIHAFLTKLGAAYREEASIIERCFPPSKHVQDMFLEKVGTDILSPYFATLYDELHSQNVDSYLKVVAGTFAQVWNFLGSLDHIQSVGGEEGSHAAADTIIARIFEPHVDLYLSEELAQFRKRSEAAVTEWDRQLSEQAASTESFYMSNINRQADKKDFLTSFKKVLMAPVAIFPSFSATLSSDNLKGDHFTKRNGNANSRSDRGRFPGDALSVDGRRSPLGTPPLSGRSTPVELPTTELAAKAAIINSKLEGIRSLFSMEVALNLVHAAKSSLERAAQFSKLKGESGRAVYQQCQAIFISLLDILGHRHVIAGFNKAVDHLSEYKPRQQQGSTQKPEQSGVEPLVTFLELVNVGDLILQMVDVFYEQELVGAKLTDRNDFLDPAFKEKRKFEQILDERVAAGLNKGIDVLMEEVEYLLATKQTGADFNPDATESHRTGIVDVGPSQVATAVVDVVYSHTGMLVGSTDKSTLDVFNQEIGLRLFTALCKHLKLQRISVDGSIKLISDMNHYFNYIQTMKNPDLLLYFAALRELSQVYLIDPSDSSEMATIIADSSRFHGIFRAEEVYEFATRRADWYQVGKNVERAMFGIGCVGM